MNYFVTAIDTDSGKTFVSAILCEALGADYWKPVQAGLPRDADRIASLVSPDKTKIFQETYLLNTPASPHAAAKAEGITIDIDKFAVPSTDKDLIIEGAGGCLVPLNQTHFIVDLIPKLKAEIVLVADLYLGSINHTLLTIEALQRRNLFIRGIIFNGPPNPESEDIIMRHSRLKCFLKIPREQHITRDTVQQYASLLKSSWNG